MMRKTASMPYQGLIFICLSLLGLTASQAAETRAILLNPVMGDIPQSAPKPVRLKVLNGEAKGCIIQGNAFLNKKRFRYEYQLHPASCVKNGRIISVGQVVRGQHHLVGTMANSGLGRDYYLSKKGLKVSLTYE
ncbi:MAG: hypothetical protein R3219_02295 [Hydrogenovibrio sp.]|nr:hypothetical protein [Hydrogenovibrio sp.]